MTTTIADGDNLCSHPCVMVILDNHGTCASNANPMVPAWHDRSHVGLIFGVLEAFMTA